MSNLGRKLLDKPYALWAVLFVLAPLCMVVYYAFTDTGGAFSLHSVSQIPSYLSTILLSVLFGCHGDLSAFGLPLCLFDLQARGAPPANGGALGDAAHVDELSHSYLQLDDDFR